MRHKKRRRGATDDDQDDEDTHDEEGHEYSGEEEEEEEEEEDEEEEDVKSEAYRRHLRHSILQHMTDTLEESRQMVVPLNREIISNIKRGDDYFRGVVHAREGTLDAEWASHISAISLEQASRIRVGQEWNPAEFLSKLTVKYARGRSGKKWKRARKRSGVDSDTDESDHEEEDTVDDEDGEEEEDDDDDDGNEKSMGTIDWMHLGRDAAQYFLRTPTVTFMNGPILTEVKKRKITRRRQQTKTDKNAKVERPEDMDEGERQRSQENETVRSVGKLYRRVQGLQRESKNGTVDYFDAVLDPNSFTKTIENMFYYSFLIKEGRAGIKYDENGDALSAKLEEPPVEDVPKKQCIMKINLDMWAKIVRNRGGDPSDKMKAAMAITGAGPSVRSMEISRRRTQMMLPGMESPAEKRRTFKRDRDDDSDEESDYDSEDSVDDDDEEEEEDDDDEGRRNHGNKRTRYR